MQMLVYTDKKQIVGWRVCGRAGRRDLQLFLQGLRKHSNMFIVLIYLDNSFTSVYISKLACNLFHISVSPLLKEKRKVYSRVKL